AGRGGVGCSPSSSAQRRPYWSGMLPHPQNGEGADGRVPGISRGSIVASPTTQRWPQPSPRSKVYWNSSPLPTVRATFAVPMSNGSASGPSGEDASPPPSSEAVTTRPSSSEERRVGEQAGIGGGADGVDVA